MAIEVRWKFGGDRMRDRDMEMRRGELQVKMNELANMVAAGETGPQIERAERAALVRKWDRGGDIRLSPCFYASANNVWRSMWRDQLPLPAYGQGPSNLGMYLPIKGDTVAVYRSGSDVDESGEPPKWIEPADVFPSEWMVANIALMIHALGRVLP